MQLKAKFCYKALNGKEFQEIEYIAAYHYASVLSFSYFADAVALLVIVSGIPVTANSQKLKFFKQFSKNYKIKMIIRNTKRIKLLKKYTQSGIKKHIKILKQGVYHHSQSLKKL